MIYYQAHIDVLYRDAECNIGGEDCNNATKSLHCNDSILQIRLRVQQCFLECS